MLPFQNFSAWVQQQAAAVQASATSLLDLTVGSVLRAILEANASVALWMQWLLLLVLQRSRLSTSSGPDADTWVADFGQAREAATFATGQVQFSRQTTGQAAFIPVGAQVKTVDGTQTFSVTADVTNPAFSVALNGYNVMAAAAFLLVPVVALTAGSSGNVAAGTIGLQATAVPGIDTVTNPVAFTNALDAETDAALRARFQLFIAGLRSAIPAAIEEAAQSVQQGVRLQLRTNYPSVGFYTLYVDDGSGNAPSNFVSAVTAAVQAVTAEGVTPIVVRPMTIMASLSVALVVSVSANLQVVEANVNAALARFIASLGIGQTLPYLQLASIVFGADPNVTGITSLTVNGAAVDVPAPIGSLIVASAISVA